MQFVLIKQQIEDLLKSLLCFGNNKTTFNGIDKMLHHTVRISNDFYFPA